MQNGVRGSVEWTIWGNNGLRIMGASSRAFDRTPVKNIFPAQDDALLWCWNVAKKRGALSRFLWMSVYVVVRNLRPGLVSMESLVMSDWHRRYGDGPW
jgi:hypothetical protein